MAPTTPTALLVALILSAFFSLCLGSTRDAITHINPNNVANSLQYSYSQAVKVRNVKEFIYVAGQVAVDQDWVVQGDTLEDQAEVAIRNIEKVLKAAGAELTDVVEIIAYIVNYDPERDFAFLAKLGQYFGEPAATAIGVEALAFPELLIEINARAVIV